MTPIEYPASNNPRVPEATQPFRHITPIQLRFNDVDMIGHVNNNAFLEYMDLGKTSYFNSVKSGLINWKFINAVVVNVNCNFYSPGYFNEPIAVLTTITSISQRSLRMEQRVINTETGDVKCAGHTIMAGFDPTTAQGAEIETQWIEAICAFEERDLRVESNS